VFLLVADVLLLCSVASSQANMVYPRVFNLTQGGKLVNRGLNSDQAEFRLLQEEEVGRKDDDRGDSGSSYSGSEG
jgi:hypothetical protein